MSNLESICEADRRLGLSHVNIAHTGVKAHRGKVVNKNLALIIFDSRKSNEITVALWKLEEGEAVTSRNLPFPAGMLWDWDWRAEAVEKAFEELLLTLDSMAVGLINPETQNSRQQLRDGCATAMAKQVERGLSVHPRIIEARAAGSNI